SEAKKTKVKRKNNNPQFDETFYFEVTRPLSYTKRQFDVEEEDVDKLALRVDLWNASNLKFGDEFLGGVRVPLRVLGQAGVHDAWYFLQPRENGGKSVKVEDLGSLRLNIVYTEDHVFPSEHYTPLRDLLLQSANVEPVSASTAHVLGEVCREKQEAAIPLVRLFLHYGKIVPFISVIAHAEINRTQDPNTIFRGNSLTSKCIDETMKLAGMHYLQVTLKPIIDEENLRHYVDRIFSVITSSGVRCPTVMCDIFFSLRESAATRFQGKLTSRMTSERCRETGNKQQEVDGEGALCSIPIENILAMFQVIQPERALYIQANNCVEARDWIDILTKVSQSNRKRLSTYHPSAYLNGHWLCCKLSADTAPG
ncbi:hypothetical protein GOODEAATRI_003332, partial [Goodea atripinnis]